MTPLDNMRVEDDGLVCPEVGPWAEDKYRMISLYDTLFSKGMRNKWGKRVYIDLYAGSGFGRIKGTSTVLKGSPILALTVPDPFDKYIFCEESEELLSVLRKRTERIAPTASVDYVLGDCDEQIDKICSLIPQYSSTQTVLSLCFVDPFDFGIKHKTVRKLSEFYIDFLVLLAIGMDATRNYDHYVGGASTKIDEALGNKDWRERWKQFARKEEFRRFLAQEFARSMESLQYLPQEQYQMKEVRTANRSLYHLALFSRNVRAFKFWQEVLKYALDQQSFRFEE